MSLGGGAVPNDGRDPIGFAIAALARRRITVLVAAGNEGTGRGTTGSPAAVEAAITVGATTMYHSFGELGFLAEPGRTTSDEIAGFSSFGPTADGRVKPDICAPGAFDWSLLPAAASAQGTGPLYELFGGTSQATPLAAGVLALAFEAFHRRHGRYPGPEESRRLLMHSADDLGYPVTMQGAGRINARRAVAMAAGQERPWHITRVLGDVGVAYPGRGRTLSVRVRNDGVAPLQVTVRATTLSPVGDEPLLVTGSVQPDRPAGELIFAVRDSHLVRATATWPGSDLPADAGRLMVALYTPDGRFANYQRAAVLGDPEESNLVETWVANPAAGNWTARVLFRSMGGTAPLPYTLKIESFRMEAWAWATVPAAPVTIASGAETDLSCAIAVPADAQPGTYSARLELRVGADTVVLPMAITVPARIRQGQGRFQGSFQHGRQGSWQNGDWHYVGFRVPHQAGALVAALQWPDVENIVEMYLIGPDGRPHLARTSTGSPFVRGHQLALATPAAGRWQVAVHSVGFSGRSEPEPFRGAILLTDRLVEPEAVDLAVRPGKGAPVALQVRNPGPVPMAVTVAGRLRQLGIQTLELVGELQPGLDALGQAQGHLDLGSVMVPPETHLMATHVRWEPAVGELALTLYEPVATQSRVSAFDRDGTVMAVEYHPIPGLWRVGCGLTLPAEAGRIHITATVLFLAPEPLTAVSSSPVVVPARGSAVVPAYVQLPVGADGAVSAELVVQTAGGDILGSVPLHLRPSAGPR